ncbi:MAG: U32 family peptidase [Thermodesulfobacteriota bacterium]
MELSLGPVLFDWKREDLLKFYDRVKDMEVSTVFLGEVVCSRRMGLTIEDLKNIAGTLAKNGKKVFLSTLAIVSNDHELDNIRELCKLGYSIEANDVSAIAIAGELGAETSAGPHITCYNTGDIEFLKKKGIERITFPVELPAPSIQYNIENSNIRSELFAHGKLPLAFSWRCYTSRAFGLTADNCEFDCRKFPDGMEINSLDNEPLFTINGKSILSNSTCTLIEQIDELKAMGASALRVSPQSKDTDKVVKIFKERIDSKIDNETAVSGLKDITGGGLTNGWFKGAAGKDYIRETEKRLASSGRL